MVEAKKAQTGTVGNAVMEWLGEGTPQTIGQEIQAVDIKWVSDGEACRISISMLGSQHRSEVIQMMNMATGTERKSGSPQPSPLERDLAAFCGKFQKLNMDPDDI